MLRGFALLLCFCCLAAVAEEDRATVKRNLEKLQQRIGAVEKRLEAAAAERSEAEQALRGAEKQAAGARRALAELETRIADAESRSGRLSNELDQSRAQLARELTTLGGQLRSAYVAGQEQWLRLLLSANDPLSINQQLIDYGYLSKARKALIDGVRAELSELVEQAQRLEAEEARLAGLRAQQTERLAQVQLARDQRQAALASVADGIETETARLETLRAEAATLTELMNELTRALADVPLATGTGFAARRGKLDWPAGGPELFRYGEARADGRMRWQGSLLGAETGADVRAVHEGRVAFADWLPGLGLLTVLEHGDGFLTLYGHNRDLTRAVGEWVESGDVIAHVGDTGGQATAGLYFEIRRDGRPVDPRGWMR